MQKIDWYQPSISPNHIVAAFSFIFILKSAESSKVGCKILSEFLELMLFT